MPKVYYFHGVLSLGRYIQQQEHYGNTRTPISSNGTRTVQGWQLNQAWGCTREHGGENRAGLLGDRGIPVRTSSHTWLQQVQWSDPGFGFWKTHMPTRGTLDKVENIVSSRASTHWSLIALLTASQPLLWPPTPPYSMIQNILEADIKNRLQVPSECSSVKFHYTLDTHAFRPASPRNRP